MNLKGVLESGLRFSPGDSVSRVASKMVEEGETEALIWDDGFLGIVSATDISRKNVSDPSSMNISHFLRRFGPLPSDVSPTELMNHVLVSGLRSIPVENEGKIYMVKKSSLLGFIKEDVFSGKKAKDIMVFPYCISTDDDVSTAISMMNDLSVNRIPVLDNESRAVGMVDSLSALKILTEKHRSKRGERSGEKIDSGGVGVSSVMRTDFMRSDIQDGVKGIISSISSKGADTVVVEDGGRFSGIITVKEIFKLAGRPVKNAFVKVSGMGHEDEFIKGKIDEMINRTAEKLGKRIPVNYLAINVEKHMKGGKRTKYSVQGRMETARGSFYASDYAWDLTKATKSFLEKIEREVGKYLGKSRARR